MTSVEGQRRLRPNVDLAGLVEAVADVVVVVVVGVDEDLLVDGDPVVLGVREIVLLRLLRDVTEAMTSKSIFKKQARNPGTSFKYDTRALCGQITE